MDGVFTLMLKSSITEARSLPANNLCMPFFLRPHLNTLRLAGVSLYPLLIIGTLLFRAALPAYGQNASITQIGADIDGEAAGDNSGFSVASSYRGDTVAIGARFNDGNGSNAGHVRVFVRQGNTWSQLGGDIDGEASGDLSGYSVSLSADGRRVAIGAPYNDGNGSHAGHVRVYELNANNTWSQLGGDIDGEAAGDKSGWSVSLSADGRRVAIGAP